MALPELEAWQCSVLAAAVTSALFLGSVAFVEGCKALTTRVTYSFLEAHKSVDSVAGAISDHWGQLAVVATLFLGHTIIQSQSTTINKYQAEQPWTVAFYVSLTIAGASCYATSVFLCIVHRTATAGLKEIAMTKYVLSMPRCIGGPLLLDLTAWVLTDIASTISFMLEQNLAVAVYSFFASASCWSIVSYTAYSAFTRNKHQVDLDSIEERWLVLHEGHSEPDDDDEEDALHGVQDQDRWCLVTHTLANEILEKEEKSKKNSEFSTAIKDFADAQHEHCLAKLKNTPTDQHPHDLITAFQGLHLARQLAV
mmetsp:Transcript_83922/g.246093  ORF Transcript_83922/g.246093 Transcript_83922/m.246093 type:complete len:311 (+) Transcript_83922:111-1043(+)